MTTTIYHVFSTGMDEYFDADKFDQAKAQYLEWGDLYGTARLYLERWPKNHKELQSDSPISEECLMATGDYPQ